MTVQQMLNSLPTLQKMMNLKLPIKKAYQIYILAKRMNEQREFFINKEKQLIAEYGAEVLSNGNLCFKNNDDQQAFMKEHAALLECEIETLEVIEISLSDLPNAPFTPAEIMNIENIISFI